MVVESDDPSVVVALHDDDRVAYAYLIDHDRVVGFVWLYNVLLTPLVPTLPDPRSGPPLNSGYFVNPTRSPPRLTETSAVRCLRLVGGVEIEVDGMLWARLAVGSRPGWSVLVERPGPLGLPFP